MKMEDIIQANLHPEAEQAVDQKRAEIPKMVLCRDDPSPTFQCG